MKKVIIVTFISILLLFFTLIWWTSKNDPYSSDTWVKPFFNTTIDKNGEIILKQVTSIHVLNTPFNKVFMYIQDFFRIEGDVLNSEKPFKGDENRIIEKIHRERFLCNRPYVISGGHFSELYVRNLGIFYNAMLDSRIVTSKKDWIVRQESTLQTIAVDLELLRLERGIEYTTFIPINSNTFVSADFNTYPSDSLFAIVYTLNVASDPKFISSAIPTKYPIFKYPLQTKKSALLLIFKYRSILSKAVSSYLNYVINPQDGLIKKDIYLASARDSLKRKSSFYDNVIAWATARDATKLGIIISCPNIYLNKNNLCDFDKWKQNIINNFWNNNSGLFINDLSQASIKNHTFTGEEFIVIPIGFFNVSNAGDRSILVKMINFVRKNNLDKPFPLIYSQKNDIKNLDFFVKYFAPSYMGDSIWSHLGQQYIETLILLSPYEPSFLIDAQKYVEIYKNNIIKYGGYPELYNKNGNIFRTLFYKSMLHTGWVINFEQTEMLFNNYSLGLKN